jgi:hypothetical protein
MRRQNGSRGSWLIHSFGATLLVINLLGCDGEDADITSVEPPNPGNVRETDKVPGFPNEQDLTVTKLGSDMCNHSGPSIIVGLPALEAAPRSERPAGFLNGFVLYWPLCNQGDRTPTDAELRDYELIVSRIEETGDPTQPFTTVEERRIQLREKALARCACFTQLVGVNRTPANVDGAIRLQPDLANGLREFKLSAPHASVKAVRAPVSNGP